MRGVIAWIAFVAASTGAAGYTVKGGRCASREEAACREVSGWSEPDPQRIHVAAMQQAVHNVSKDTETPLEEIRVWVDYVSIPQRNRSVQKTAIISA